MVQIKNMFNEYNAFAKSFKMAKENFDHITLCDLKLKLISNRNNDDKIYNLPIIFEVVALIVGDTDDQMCRDMIL